MTVSIIVELLVFSSSENHSLLTRKTETFVTPYSFIVAGSCSGFQLQLSLITVSMAL